MNLISTDLASHCRTGLLSTALRDVFIPRQNLTKLRSALFIATGLLQCLYPMAKAWAATPTTTTLAVSPGGAFGPQQIISLKATVADSAGPLTHGSVSFYDGAHLLYTAQLVSLSTGGYTPGSATYRTKLPAGTHLLSAKFLGTTGELQSTSTQVATSISGVEPSMTVLVKTGTAGTYQLAGSVYGFGRTPPTGSIGFFDTAGNSLLGTGTLSAGSPSSAFVATSFVSSDLKATRPISADIDGDGIPDLAYLDIKNALVVLLGKGDGTFGAPKSSSLGSTSSAFGTFAFADMNGDGILDCVVGSNFANVIVLLGNGDGTFGAPQTIPAGDSNANGVTVGDFNGDGFPDIAVAQLSGTVTVLLGSASGSYAASTFSVPIQPVSIQAVDLNNDGKTDLVTFPLVTALGHGDGTFSVVSSLQGLSDSFMNQLAVADVNGDGIPDFVLGQWEVGIGDVGVLEVLLGKGDGSFTTPGWTYQYPADRLLGFTIASVESSTNPSILAMSFNPTTSAFTLDTFIGNGNGTFKTPVTTPHAPSTPFFGDLNGDGLTDIVNVFSEGYLPSYGPFTTELAASVSTTTSFTPSISAGRSTTFVGQYAGDGAFAASVSQAVALQGTTSVSLSVAPSTATPGTAVTFTAKVTDGVGAIVTGGTVFFYDGQVLLGSSSVGTSGTHAGTATYVTSTLAIGIHSITARYVGTAVYGNSLSSAQIVSIAGKYSTTTSLKASGSPGNYTLAASVAGLGFGAPTGTITFTDLTTGTVLGTKQLPSAGASPNYSVTGTMATGTYPGSPVVADFNRDGFDDLALANQDGTLSVYLAQGDGTLAPPHSYSVNAASGGLVAGDFNGDGILDLAVSGYYDQSVQVLIGNGDGTFQNAITGIALSGTEYAALAVGDFDQDGHLDLAMVDEGNSLVRVLKGNGDGTFRLLQTYADAGGLNSVQASDLNGDGKLDLVYHDIGGGSIELLFGNGDGTFAYAGFGPFNGSVNTPMLVDVNGDGHSDILAQDGTNSTLDVALGKGDGSFASGQSYGTPVPCVACTFHGTFVDTLDFNHDGVLDAAVLNPNAGTFTLFQGKGDGTFTATSTLSVGASATGIRAASLAAGLPALLVTYGGSATGPLALITAYPQLSVTLTSISAPGSDQVQATYSGDPSFASSTSPAIVLNGDLTPSPTLTLNLGTFSNAIAGAPIPVTVTVGGVGTSVPTGTVQLYDNGSPVGSAVALSGGQASFTTSGLVSAGTRFITAKYSGDSFYNPATSPAVTVQVVAIGGDSISLTTSVATTQYGGVTIPLSGVLGVSSLGANPTGTFALYDGSNQIATSPVSGNAPITVSFNVNTAATPLSTGTHTLSLRYSGDSNWASAVSPNLVLTINAPDFTVGTGSGGSTNLSVTRGGSVSTPLTVGASGSFTGTITLTCSGNPSESTCSISPSSLVNSGAATLTISTTAAHASLRADPPSRGSWLGSGSAALALLFLFVRPRRVRRLGLLLVCLCCLLGIAGCGGTSNNSPKSNPDPGTPAGQYSLTVTATSGSISHTIPIQLTIN